MNFGAKHVGMVSELILFVKHLHHLNNIVFTKRVLLRYQTAELTTHIVKWNSENEIYLHFHVTAALFEVVEQFLKWTLRNVTVLPQQTLEQRSFKIGV